MAVKLADLTQRQLRLAASHAASRPVFHRQAGESRLPALSGGIDIVVVRNVDPQAGVLQVQQVRAIDGDPANGFEATGDLIETQPWPGVLLEYYVAFATEGAVGAATNVLPLLTTAGGVYLMQQLKWAIPSEPNNYPILDGTPG